MSTADRLDRAAVLKAELREAREALGMEMRDRGAAEQELAEARDENARLRVALDLYADERHWSDHEEDPDGHTIDFGHACFFALAGNQHGYEIARAALKETTP